MRKKFLVYDCSGSTTEEYWKCLRNLDKEHNFNKFIAWGAYAKVEESLCEATDGIANGTDPQTALELVQEEYKSLEGEWDLYITTDGLFTHMTESEYNEFISQLTFIEYFKKICVYYIGFLDRMNLFLNHFLCQNEDFETHVFDINKPLEECTIKLTEDIDCENYLIAKIQIITLLTKYKNQPEVIQQIRKRVTDYYAKKEKTLINVKVIENLTAHIVDNEIVVTSDYAQPVEDLSSLTEIEQTFASRIIENIYKEFLFNTKILNESNLLNLFSKDFNYLFRGTIVQARQRSKVPPIKAPLVPKSIEKHDLSTCSIMFEELTAPAIIIKRSNLDLSSSEWAQPFQLITYKFQSFKNLFELNQINLSTYEKLVEPGSNSFKSPFTREECCGVFILSSSALEHNCKVLSLAMGHNYKFYGNILNWNLCCFYMLFLLYKTKQDVHMQYLIANEIIELITNNNMSIYWMLSRPTEFKTSVLNTLWFIINFSISRIKSNNSLLLRKWGYPLFQFYTTFVNQFESNYEDKIDECFVWAWLVREKTDIWSLIQKLYNFEQSELPSFIKKNKNLTYYLFKKFLNKRSKLINIPSLDNFNPDEDIKLEFPTIKISEINKDYHDDILKIEIDPQTCRPSEVCCHKEKYKNCKQHVQLDFEYKKAISVFRIFALYCIQNKKYPKSTSELFDFYKNLIFSYLKLTYVKKDTPFKNYPVFIFDNILEILSIVYDKYQTIANNIDVKTFVDRYNESDKSKYKKIKKLN